jgi:integrase
MRASRGTKRRRGRGSWELAVRMNGKRYTKTIHVTTDENAENALLDFRRELRDEGVPERDPTVRESSEEWLQVVRGRVKDRTAIRYEQLLRCHVWPVIGEVRRRKLPPGDVRHVIDLVRATRSQRTALHVYRVLAEYLAETERWGMGPNVAKLVRPPRPGRPELTIPTAEETLAILDVVKGSIAEGPTILGVFCGLRVGESLAERRGDIDLDRARLTVTATMHRGGRTEPKTARARRTVAMPAFACRYMREHLAAQAERRLASVAWADGDYVFDRGGGMPMSVESVSRRFGQLVERIGLGSVRAHDMRHAYATRLLEAGVHPKVVSEALGHATVGITLDTYSHVLPSMSRTAADAIDAVFGGS